MLGVYVRTVSCCDHLTLFRYADPPILPETHAIKTTATATAKRTSGINVLDCGGARFGVCVSLAALPLPLEPLLPL